MAFRIEFTPTAIEHVRGFRKSDQKILIDGIEEQLRHQPTTETRNRKKLTTSELSDWELRVEDFRVFYDVVGEGEARSVVVKAVGYKEHNKLYVGGQEVKL